MKEALLQLQHNDYMRSKMSKCCCLGWHTVT